MSTRCDAAAQPVYGESRQTGVEGEQRLAECTQISMRVKLRHVLLLGGLTAIGPLSTDMYLPALPGVSQDLGAPMSLIQLTLTAGIFGLSLGQLIVGPLSDARGRRWPLLIGLALFALTSLLCSMAPSVAMLTFVRFVQGLAGAAGVVIALAIARDLYAGVALARCIAMLMTVNFLAPIIAPVLGGQLLRFSSWNGVFVAIALIGVMLLLASAFGLGETLPPERRQAGGITSTVQAFRLLLTDRRFLGYALASSFAFAAGIVYISTSPFVLQGIYKLSPQHFSLMFGLNAVGLAVMSQISARLVRRVSPQTLLTWGVAAIAAAAVALLVVVLSRIGLAGILAAFFVMTASLGLIAPNATALALADTDAQTAGSASALLGVLQFSIGAVVAPLVGLAGATSAVPMAAMIATFGVAALVTVLVFCRPAPASSRL